MYLLVDQFRVLGLVDQDGVRLSFPMAGKHNDGLGFHLLCDLLSDVLEDGIHRMFGIILDVGLVEC